MPPPPNLRSGYIQLTSKSHPREVAIKNLVQLDISSLEPTDLHVHKVRGYLFRYTQCSKLHK